MRKPSHPHAERLTPWFLSFLFLTTLAVYINTLGPALFRNDSPETITACATLGVSHPPGYPLYSLLGRLFSLRTVGNPAMTLNLFSAFLSALGVLLFFLNAWQLLGSLARKKDRKGRVELIVTSIAISFCFAFSRNYWSAALAAKGGIYNLQVALELALLLFLQTWPGGRKTLAPRDLFLFTFLFGLGLANHWPTQALLLPALILVGLWSSRHKFLKAFRWKTLWTTLSLFLIPLSLYLFLPLRSHLYPALNFWAPFTIQRFVSSLFRVEYFRIETMASFLPSALTTLESKGLYIVARFWTELGVPLAILALGGAVLLWRSGKKSELLFLVTVLATTLAANLVYLQVTPIEFWHMDDHLLTVNWVTAILGLVGLCGLGNRFRRLGLALAVLVPVITFCGNQSLNDQRGELLYHGYGMEALKSMDRGAFYFAETDYDYFSVLYLTEVEHKRPDVGLTLTTFWDKKYWRDLMQHQYGARFAGPHPIYCCFPNGAFIEENKKLGTFAAFIPTGTIIEVKTSAVRSMKPQLQPLDELWDRYLLNSLGVSNPINGLVQELCAHPYLNMSNYLKLRGNYEHWDDYYDHALSLMRNSLWRAQTLEKKAEVDLQLGDKHLAIKDYHNSSTEFQKAGMTDKANELWLKAVKLEPSEYPWNFNSK